MKKLILLLLTTTIFLSSTMTTQAAQLHNGMGGLLLKQASTYVDNQHPDYDITLPEDVQEYLYDECMDHGWSYEYLLAIAYKESRFDIKAININKDGTKDGGVMQVNQCNFKWIDSQLPYNLDLSNPYHNIDAALVMLDYLRTKFSGMDMSQETLFFMVTLAYNRGEGGALDFVKYHGFNSEYVDDVYGYKEQLERYGTIN